MLPAVFPLLNTPEVQAFVGSDPVRIFDFGKAPQDVIAPYIVFNQVADSPYEQISGSPCSDFMTVQVDCYSKDKGEIRGLAKAVRIALDVSGYSNRLIIQTQEDGTLLYRISFEVDLIENR